MSGNGTAISLGGFMITAIGRAAFYIIGVIVVGVVAGAAFEGGRELVHHRPDIG